MPPAATTWNIRPETYLVDKDGRLRATFFNAPVNDIIQVTRSVL